MKKYSSALRFFLATCFAVGALHSGFSQVKKLPIVRTENGLVSGTGSTDGKVQVFKGIPFAAPPVGDLRWKAPQPAKNWDGVRACTKFPPSAMQPVPEPFFVWSEEFMAPKEPLSEDCLYLNIWAPANYEAKNLPVIVWVHGGGFMSGSGSCPIYDGQGMAEKGVVFVTINYRLGVFGFLAHPELSAESGQGSGNYAFLDQLAALRWVQRNIAAFGGDPNRATVAGQSAGAFSVNALVASPLAKGLFQRAIAESGGMFTSDRAKPLAVAEQDGAEFLKKSGAADLAGLRKLPADYLLKQPPVNNPVVDGYVLPTNVATVFSEGKQNDVPVLAGWNSGDGFLFGKAPTAAEFQQQMKSRYGKFSQKLLGIFPAGDDVEAEKSQIRLNRDLIFAWQSHLWAKAQRQSGRSKIWLYQFDRVPPGRPDLEQHGAFHSAEIAYALNTLPMWRRPWEPADREISALMSDYWVHFAANGDPNTDSLPEWKDWQPGQDEVMNFNALTTLNGRLMADEFGALDEWLAAGSPDYSLFKKEVFVNGTDTLPYRILFPENYDRSKSYPVVLFLHGAGERGTDNEVQLVHGASLFLKKENRRDFPCIAVFPQCQKETAWGTVKVDRTKTPLEFSFDYTASAPTKNMTAVLALVHQLRKKEAVDSTRIYISGLSMGGFGTFEAVWREPGLFAAAAPICGGGDAKNYSEAAAKVPFWIFHGAADAVVPAEGSREMHRRLQELGAEVKYSEYPGVNHNSWENAFAEKDYLPWMFSQKK